jgi:predicted helicase
VFDEDGHQIIEGYKRVDGKPLGERNPKWLQDDYVKFIRFGQWRIERTGHGILGFITNHAYLDNPTFRGMRQSLMNSFSEIYLLDLHGNVKKREVAPDGSKDENVFDIQQGVAIGIFVREPGKSGPARVYHADLWGLREPKYQVLAQTDVAATPWAELHPASPFYFFVPRREDLLAEYEQGWKVTDIFPLYGVGITTARDRVVIDYEAEPLLERATLFRDSGDSNAALCEKLGIPQKLGWNVTRARQLIRQERDLTKHIKPVLYRPFDARLLFYHDSLVWRTVRKVMRHMQAGKNVGLVSARSNKSAHMDHFFCSRHAMETKCGESTTQSCIFPLYLYPAEGEMPFKEGRHPNLNHQFIKALAEKVGLEFIPDGKGDLEKTFGPEDILHYAYALFHSPTYRSRYTDFLRTDFPRLPLTADRALFAGLVDKGAELVSLHLMESPVLDNPPIKYPVPGSHRVDKVVYEEAQRRVYINKEQYFEGIEPGVWDFSIGGYQVCQKWLKYRKGRKLSIDEAEHYQKVIVALRETIRVMAEIDTLIPSWPLV